MNWLLETEVFGEGEIEAMSAEIERHGHVVKTIPHAVSLVNIGNFRDLAYTIFGHDEPVIFYGSLGLAGMIRRHCEWVPGVWCDLQKYRCSSYYPSFGYYLLNEDYEMLPFGELGRKARHLFERFNDSESCNKAKLLFIRPDSAFKIFGGQVVTWKDWGNNLKLLNYNDSVSPNEIVVVSSTKKIASEFRLVVANGKVVSGCRYIENDEIDHGPMPENVREFGDSVINGFSPEPVWVLDIAIEDGERMSVVEINAFSTSGLYCCPMEPIIKAASEAAQREWESVR